jgi:hypothetical protein
MDLEDGRLLAMDDGGGRQERWNFCSEGEGKERGIIDTKAKK